jgi:hypothetical protein
LCPTSKASKTCRLDWLATFRLRCSSVNLTAEWGLIIQWERAMLMIDCLRDRKERDFN